MPLMTPCRRSPVRGPLHAIAISLGWVPLLLCLHLATSALAAPDAVRTRQFDAANPEAARQWQRESRELLFRLMMCGDKPARVPLDAQCVRREQPPGAPYRLE
jgi:hypothetical protein